jgi:hypothetical protein
MNGTCGCLECVQPSLSVTCGLKLSFYIRSCENNQPPYADRDQQAEHRSNGIEIDIATDSKERTPPAPREKRGRMNSQQRGIHHGGDDREKEGAFPCPLSKEPESNRRDDSRQGEADRKHDVKDADT